MTRPAPPQAPPIGANSLVQLVRSPDVPGLHIIVVINGQQLYAICGAVGANWSSVQSQPVRLGDIHGQCIRSAAAFVS